LPDNTHAARYLALAGNAERWGALAIGTSKTPPVSQLASPRPASLEALTAELLAVAEHRPPVDVRLRRRLMVTSSLGGARPKATVRDADRYWLIKPRLATDTQDIPALEHMAEQLSASCGLRTAATELHRLTDGWSVLRVLRFDRSGDQRHMAISGASLLQTEYPGGADMSAWSYPRLAEELKRIGAPDDDRHELFNRMVFNAVIGNDDDHPKNHAAVYRHEEQRWRLAPAFDVVPNPDETPGHLAMHLSQQTRTISRDAILADHIRFGFRTRDGAAHQLDSLLRRIEANVDHNAALLAAPLKEMIVARITANIALLRSA
jgi:serine/threonine-protein kinase HipA